MFLQSRSRPSPGRPGTPVHPGTGPCQGEGPSAWAGLRALAQRGAAGCAMCGDLAVLSWGGRGVHAGPAESWDAFGLAVVGAGREAEGPLEGLAEGELAGVSGLERDLREPETGAAQCGGSPAEPDRFGSLAGMLAAGRVPPREPALPAEMSDSSLTDVSQAHAVSAKVAVKAPIQLVFAHWTTPELMDSGLGTGSSCDPRDGGGVRLHQHPWPDGSQRARSGSPAAAAHL